MSKSSLVLFFLFFCACLVSFAQNKVQVWHTSEDGKNLLTKKADLIVGKASATDSTTIVVNPDKTYQKMLGFGSTLMDTDVYNLLRLNKGNQEKALEALFHPTKGMGLNLIRIGFGASDWERDTVYYSFDDMPKGQKDLELKNFNYRHTRELEKIEVLKRAMAVNPEIKIIVSIWAIPGWMKTNDNLVHDYFDSKYIDVYAKYLVKSIQAYEKEGIPIYAISPQNEPGTCNDRLTPATCVPWEQERDMIKAMKKEFIANNIKTKIWILDHNHDMAMNYAKPILDDPEAKKATDAVALHDYVGTPDSMGALHKLYPDIPVLMSERNLSTLEEVERMVQFFQNSAIASINWNSIGDEYEGPHQYGGGSRKWKKFKPNFDLALAQKYLFVGSEEPDKTFSKPYTYYKVSQFSKFIKRGALRIESKYGSRDKITNVAFKNPDGSLVFLLVNQTAKEQAFKLKIGDKELKSSIPARTIGTYLWKP